MSATEGEGLGLTSGAALAWLLLFLLQREMERPRGPRVVLPSLCPHAIPALTLDYKVDRSAGLDLSRELGVWGGGDTRGCCPQMGPSGGNPTRRPVSEVLGPGDSLFDLERPGHTSAWVECRIKGQYRMWV